MCNEEVFSQTVTSGVGYVDKSSHIRRSVCNSLPSGHVGSEYEATDIARCNMQTGLLSMIVRSG